MNPAAIAATALALILTGFGAGWTTNGWRLHTEIAEIKANRAIDSAAQSKAALDDLASASKKINEAANGYTVDIGTFGAKLDSIKKELKNVQAATKLPADCKPDPFRMRNLQAAVDATNQAIAGK